MDKCQHCGSKQIYHRKDGVDVCRKCGKEQTAK